MALASSTARSSLPTGVPTPFLQKSVFYFRVSKGISSKPLVLFAEGAGGGDSFRVPESQGAGSSFGTLLGSL